MPEAGSLGRGCRSAWTRPIAAASFERPERLHVRLESAGRGALKPGSPAIRGSSPCALFSASTWSASWSTLADMPERRGSPARCAGRAAAEACVEDAVQLRASRPSADLCFSRVLVVVVPCTSYGLSLSFTSLVSLDSLASFQGLICTVEVILLPILAVPEVLAGAELAEDGGEVAHREIAAAACWT